MPRLSLYRPQKGNDFKFIDNTVWEMFQVGGTDVFIHRYLGTKVTPLWTASTAYSADDLVSLNNTVYKAKTFSTGVIPPSAAHWVYVREGTPSQPIYTENSVSNIDDLLFLENRNRDYDEDIYVLRGVYSLQDIDFNLSQFGLFLQNDTIFITFHINDTVEKLGRKLIAGDVIELPHLVDEHALGTASYALKRYFVVEEVSRAAEGYSVTWYPHLYRAKCKPMTASQEFSDILDDLVNPQDTNSPTIGELNSNYEREMQITQAVLDQADADAPKSGYDTTKYYTLQKEENGSLSILSTDSSDIDASIEVQATDAVGNLLFNTDGSPVYVGATASTIFLDPEHDSYVGYLTGDAVPPNGAPFTSGISFPINPVNGQFCLRTDFLPTRMFRFNGVRWVKFEDNVRMTMNNLGTSDTGVDNRFEGKDVRQTQKADFINNANTAVINGKIVKEKQSLSQALRPKADE